MRGNGHDPTSAERSGLVVGLGDIAVATASAGHLVAFALGSCVAVVIYDRETRTGGLLHAFLPDGLDARYRMRVKRQPSLFINPGISVLVEQLNALRVPGNSELIAKMAGGASLVGHSGGISAIGQANVEKAREVLMHLHIPLVAEDVGGHRVRSAHLDLETGQFLVHTHGHGEVVL